MERRHLELCSQAKRDQQDHLVQLRGVHRLHTVELARRAVGGELHPKETVGRQAMAAPRHEAAQASPSVHVTDKRNRQFEILPQWHVKRLGRDEQDHSATDESRHRGSRAPRRLAIVQPSSDDHCEQPPAPAGQPEAVEVFAGFSPGKLLFSGGGIHPNEQVADAESDQQRVCVDLLGMRPEGNGDDRPHGMVVCGKKNTQLDKSPLGVWLARWL